MSTKVLSPKATSIKQYKKDLLKVEELLRQGRKGAFKVATLLVAIFNDMDFRHDCGVVDDDRAAEFLDKFTQDYFCTFFQIKTLVEAYPKAKDWAGDLSLKQMFDSIPARESTVVRKPRKTATVAQLEAAKDQTKRVEHRLKRVEKEVEPLRQRAETLQEENARLKRELAAAHKRIAELEAQLGLKAAA